DAPGSATGAASDLGPPAVEKPAAVEKAPAVDKPTARSASPANAARLLILRLPFARDVRSLPRVLLLAAGRTGVAALTARRRGGANGTAAGEPRLLDLGRSEQANRRPVGRRNISWRAARRLSAGRARAGGLGRAPTDARERPRS